MVRPLPAKARVVVRAPAAVWEVTIVSVLRHVRLGRQGRRPEISLPLNFFVWGLEGFLTLVAYAKCMGCVSAPNGVVAAVSCPWTEPPASAEESCGLADKADAVCIWTSSDCQNAWGL